MSARRSMTPVLAACCDQPCQVLTCTGIWHYSSFYVDAGVTYHFGEGPSVGLIFPNGDSFIFQYVFQGNEGYPGPSDFSFTDYLFGSFESSNPGSWTTPYSQATVFLPPEGATYEFLISWCPECANGITVDFRINTSTIVSYTITNACDPTGGASLDFSHVGLQLAGYCEGQTVTNVTNFSLDCGFGLPPAQPFFWFFEPPGGGGGGGG